MRRSERIAAIVTSLAGLAVMVYAWKMLRLGTIHVPDAGLFPFVCGLGLAILGVLWILLVPAKAEQTCSPEGERLRPYRPLASLVLMVLYAWAMESLGYLTSTFLFMVAWQKIIERERWLKTVLITVLGTLAMYALFRLFLQVPVPEELFLR